MKKIILFLCLLIPCGVSAFDFAIENEDGITIYYDKQGDSEPNLTVVRGEIQYAGDIKLPTVVVIDNILYTVTKIGPQAFMGCPNLVSIDISETITDIGEQAFNNDYQLEIVSFSDNILTIGEGAFAGCTKIKRITLPAKMNYIAPKTFQNCSELEEIVLPSSLTVINNRDYDNSNPFGGCTKLKKIVVESLDSWLNIILYGSSQPFYDYHLFIGQQEVKDLVIPSHISSIKNNAFQNCTGLESITIPDHVTTIGRSAFYNCGSIRRLNIGNGVTSLGNWALCGCYPDTIDVPSIDIWLKVVSKNIMDNSSTIFNFQLISNGMLVESLEIPEGVSSIEDRAFSGCSSIKSISFPYTTTSIGYLSFGYCDNLVSVNIRNGIASIGENAFSGCRNLENVVLPNSISEISPFCFSGCTSLKSIDIPYGVKRIGGNAFQGCTNLENVNIPNSVTEIGGDYDSYDDWRKNHVFDGCTSLETIDIPSSVEYIGSFSFYGCSNLITVKLSENLKYISRQCFQDCRKLKTIVIGCNTKRISYGAFWNCSSLQEVVCNAIEPPIAETTDWSIYQSSFKGVNLGAVNLYVPYNSVESYKENAPWNCFRNIRAIGYFNVTLSSIGGGQINFKSDAIRNNTVSYEIEAKDGLKLFFVSDEGHSIDSTSVNGLSYGKETTFSLDSLTTDLIVTVNFIANSYTLTYVVDNEVYKTYTLEYGADITPEDEPKKTGYTFSGWSEIPSTMPAKDLTISGAFAINTYKLKYVVDGVDYKTLEIEYNSTITPEQGPTKEGYTFSGWSEIPQTMPAFDVTVTGSFIVNKYKITYIIDGDVFTTDYVEFGASIVPPAVDDKEGYKFDGWMNVPETMPAHDITIYGSFTSGIAEISFGHTNDAKIYTVNGKHISRLQRGVNIIRYSDGRVRKINVK